MQATASSLGSKVNVHCEENVGFVFTCLSNNLPLRNQRLPARCPRLICRIDTSRVVLQRRAGKYLVGVESAAWVRLVEADKVWFVEIGDADVAAWLATILIVSGCDIRECVVWATSRGDGGT